MAKGSRAASGITAILAPLPERLAERVKAHYREMGGRYSVWEESDKVALVEALFRVEDDLEHKQAGTPPRDRKDVPVLHQARLLVEHSLGWDEQPFKTKGP